MSDYFVFRIGLGKYRVYGTRNHIEPPLSDPRCVWRGDCYKSAILVAKRLVAQDRWGDMLPCKGDAMALSPTLFDLDAELVDKTKSPRKIPA